MKPCVVYASPRGRTAEVAAEAVGRFRFPCSLRHVSELESASDFDTFILFSPTFGDEELHVEMESFLRTLPRGDKSFVLCELGNYYGYDEPDFGAARIMRMHLTDLGWREVAPALSLDALPVLDHEAFEAWTARLNDEFSP